MCTILKPSLPDSPYLAAFDRAFQQFTTQVAKPLEQIKIITDSKQMHRCTRHHSIFTLYCETDRRILCSNCMYDDSTHRKHKVIPLNKALTLVSEDIVSLQNFAEPLVKQCHSLCSKLHSDMAIKERYYLDTIRQVKVYYKELNAMLKKKQEEHIVYLNETRESQKQEVSYYQRKVKEVMNLLSSSLTLKFDQQKEGNHLVGKHAVLAIITKSQPFVAIQLPELTAHTPLKQLVDFDEFDKIKEHAKAKLQITQINDIKLDTKDNLWMDNKPTRLTPDFKRKRTHEHSPAKGKSKSVSGRQAGKPVSPKKVKFKFP